MYTFSICNSKSTGKQIGSCNHTYFSVTPGAHMITNYIYMWDLKIE